MTYIVLSGTLSLYTTTYSMWYFQLLVTQSKLFDIFVLT